MLDKTFRRHRRQLFTLYAGIFLTVAVLLDFLVYTIKLRDEELFFKQNAILTLNTYRDALLQTLRQTGKDALLLSSLTSLDEYLVDSDNHSKEEADRDFLKFATLESNIYDQVRYIDERGMERIRINRSTKMQPVIVPGPDLQSKANRYYFKESVNLEQGNIYLSQFDLNVENEKIEIPFKPMLRISTPVVDSHGKARGVVVLNLLGSVLLDQLELRAGTEHGGLYLLNPMGYWLKGPDADSEWGFMFEDRKDKTLAQTDSLIWKKLNETNEGYFSSAGASWGFLSINPFGFVNPLPTASDYVASHEGYHWILLLKIPEFHITASPKANAELVGLFLLFASIPILILSWFVADSRVRRRTQMKQEREREELQKVQSLARAVAHEFRQPLAGLQLAADMIRMTEHDPETVRAMSQRIPVSVARIDALVKRLLSITQVETIPYPGDTEIINLQEMSLKPPPDGDAQPGTDEPTEPEKS